MTSPEMSVSLPDGYELIALDEVDSTMEQAKRVALDWFQGRNDRPVWIIANRQTSGRGRRGRAWETSTGNLATTLLMRPQISVEAAAQLSFVTALSLADLIETYVGPEAVSLKWPNDVLVQDKKIAGILLESSASGASELDWVSIGIGVNLQSYPADMPYPATSLSEVHPTHKAPRPEAFLSELADRFDRLLRLFLDSGFEPIRDMWLARAKGLGEPIVARLVSEEVEGTLVSLAENGALIIRLQTGEERVISAGEVFFP